MNRPALFILATLLAGSAGFGVYQFGQVRKLTRDAAHWETEKAALQKRILDLQKKSGDTERGIAAGPVPSFAVQGAGPVPAATARAGAADGPGPLPRSRNESDGGRRLGSTLANPEVQRLMALQQKAALDGRYSALFKQLQLSPADLEKFKMLLVDKQSAVMDVMAAARGEGLDGRDGREQIRQLVQDTRAEVDSAIRATLGDAVYAQYQNFEATQPQRSLVTQLEQRLSYSSTPLTDTQSRQLVQIMVNNPPATAGDGRTGSAGNPMAMGGSPHGFGGGTTITDAAISQAQGILSAQQTSALRSLQQEQQAGALLMKRMRENAHPTSPGAATGGGPQPTIPTPAR